MLTSDASEATVKGSVPADRAPRKKDEKLWFNDGTLIIVAQDTEFRVYKGQLERRSEVFKDMSSFPQPTADCADSPCPVVHVTDSAREWRHVLGLIFDPDDEQSPFPTARRPHPSFELISACVRLGHKYAMTSTYQAAMAYLKDHFTTSFSVFQKHGSWVPEGDDFGLVHTIGVVNLARLTGERTLLPLALLECCRKGADIVLGFTYSDGERETLVAEDVGLCFAAKDKLIAATILAYVNVFGPLPARDCKLEDCRRALGLLSQSTSRKALSCPSPNPIISFNYTLPGATTPQLCEDCRTTIKERERRRQLANWKALPSMLGIDVPAW
ncbi:hypothetical protein K466DRAFT_553494 [Polyporus arcularius HHB13444]|uniref:BTB domain-containing protein n=1 Tax=Polyporus arcularius HHB13444 TaxID=1314778 RepID=A0A5C3P8E1_9APHY|nr:hypothetical protein K466DRAFT_553494 [Polyporus arcularius HHB13444]